MWANTLWVITEFCSHQRNTVCPVWCVQGLCGSKTFNMIQKRKEVTVKGRMCLCHGWMWVESKVKRCASHFAHWGKVFEPNILWQTVWVSVFHWLCVNANVNILNPREELQFKLSKCQQRRCSGEWWTKEISECRKDKTIKPVVKLSNRTRPVCSINLKSCENIILCYMSHTSDISSILFPIEQHKRD